MSQNTEQNVRTREEQVDALYHGRNTYSTITQDRFRDELVKAEARGRAEERAKSIGYLFDNPDTGTEYLPYHPIESGECQDAENIREATGAELLSELQNAWKSWKEDRDEKEKVSANIAALEAQKYDGWEPIASAPKNGTLVDLWVRPIWSGKARRVIDAWWTDTTGWRSGTEVSIEGKVTFWRACPPAPGNSPQVQAVAPASDPFQVMTDDQLSERLKAVQARWDELMDSDEELGGGSPMESMDEEMQSLQNEIARRAALTREGGV